MLLLALTLGAGLLAGWARGGRPHRLLQLPVRSLWLLVAALLVQAAAWLAGHGGGTGSASHRHAAAAATVVAAVLGLAFLARNRGLTGTGLLAVGLGLNAVVVLANAAMPVSASAAHRAGVSAHAVAATPGHRLGTGHARLAVLADVIPLPLPGGEQVLSVGDVLVVAGLACLVCGAMLDPDTAESLGGAGDAAGEGDRLRPGERADAQPWPRRQLTEAPLPGEVTADLQPLAAALDPPPATRPQQAATVSTWFPPLGEDRLRPWQPSGDRKQPPGGPTGSGTGGHVRRSAPSTHADADGPPLPGAIEPTGRGVDPDSPAEPAPTPSTAAAGPWEPGWDRAASSAPTGPREPRSRAGRVRGVLPPPLRVADPGRADDPAGEASPVWEHDRHGEEEA